MIVNVIILVWYYQQCLSCFQQRNTKTPPSSEEMPPGSSVCLYSDTEHPTDYTICYEMRAHHIMYQNNIWCRLVTARDLFWCRDRPAGIASCGRAHHQGLSPTMYALQLASDAALPIPEMEEVLEGTYLKQKGCCKGSPALERTILVNLVFQTGKNTFK